MLVYIDDREDEEFDADYGYDYGSEEDGESNSNVEELTYDYAEPENNFD